MEGIARVSHVHQEPGSGELAMECGALVNPIIVGLYVCFPLLAVMLKRWGLWAFLAFAAILTYGSIFMFASLSGRYRGHQEAIFLFFVIQFALGMTLAYVRERHPLKLDRLLGFKSFVAGCVFYLLSWGLRTYVPNGRSYNDGLTTVGVFLVLLNVIWIMRMRSPIGTRILSALGKQSYLIFLLHYPIMAFAVGPLLGIALHPAVMVALGLVFVSGVYALCSLHFRADEQTHLMALRSDSALCGTLHQEVIRPFSVHSIRQTVSPCPSVRYRTNRFSSSTRIFLNNPEGRSDHANAVTTTSSPGWT